MSKQQIYNNMAIKPNEGLAMEILRFSACSSMLYSVVPYCNIPVCPWIDGISVGGVRSLRPTRCDAGYPR
jgi:hypothetical protein